VVQSACPLLKMVRDKWVRRTEVETPSKVVDARLGKLYDKEAAHPVRRSGSRRASGSPAEAVDLRVEHPGYLGEAGSVREIVQEEHSRCYSSQCLLVLGLKVCFSQSDGGYKIATPCSDRAIEQQSDWKD
jgi:hypothetical protein